MSCVGGGVLVVVAAAVWEVVACVVSLLQPINTAASADTHVIRKKIFMLIALLLNGGSTSPICSRPLNVRYARRESQTAPAPNNVPALVKAPRSARTPSLHPADSHSCSDSRQARTTARRLAARRFSFRYLLPSVNKGEPKSRRFDGRDRSHT